MNFRLIISLILLTACYDNYSLKDKKIVQKDSIFKPQNLECIKCNIELCKIIDSTAEKTTIDQLNCFLEGLNKQCKNNVEYSEYSNAILFKISYLRTRDVLMSLNRNNIDTSYIFDVYRNPNLDYDIDSLIRLFEKATYNNRIKSRIIIQLQNVKSSDNFE
jgi:hypothetical protein